MSTVRCLVNLHDIQGQDCHLFCPGMLRRCCSGQRSSSFAAVALNQPVINSSYRNTHTHTHTPTDPVIWSIGGLCTDLSKCRIIFYRTVYSLNTARTQAQEHRNQKNVACSKIHIHIIFQFWQICVQTHRETHLEGETTSKQNRLSCSL